MFIELLLAAASVEFNAGNGAESAALWYRILGQFHFGFLTMTVVPSPKIR